MNIIAIVVILGYYFVSGDVEVNGDLVVLVSIFAFIEALVLFYASSEEEEEEVTK